MLIAAMVTAMLVIFWPRSSALYAQLEQAEERIKKDVNDEERRKQALAILGQMKTAQKEKVEERKKTVDSLTEVLNRRESTSAQIEAAVQPLDGQDVSAAEKYLDQRFELTKVLTESEWVRVFAPTGAASPADKKDDAGSSR